MRDLTKAYTTQPFGRSILATHDYINTNNWARQGWLHFDRQKSFKFFLYLTNVDTSCGALHLSPGSVQEGEKLNKYLNVNNLYDISDPWIPYINNAIKAKILFIKDTNYIVRDNEIVIIDEFTGRIMADRRWGDGLHQAVEAKEGVPIKKGSETLGSVTYQNFFLSHL